MVSSDCVGPHSQPSGPRPSVTCPGRYFNQPRTVMALSGLTRASSSQAARLSIASICVGSLASAVTGNCHPSLRPGCFVSVSLSLRWSSETEPQICIQKRCSASGQNTLEGEGSGVCEHSQNAAARVRAESPAGPRGASAMSPDPACGGGRRPPSVWPHPPPEPRSRTSPGNPNPSVWDCPAAMVLKP